MRSRRVSEFCAFSLTETTRALPEAPSSLAPSRWQDGAAACAGAATASAAIKEPKAKRGRIMRWTVWAPDEDSSHQWAEPNSTRAIFSNVVRRAGMLVVGLVLLLCGSARAGTYEVWACADADGKPVPADGWRSEGYGYYSSPSNDCAGGNGLYAGLNGAFAHAANAETVTWHFQTPASLKITSYR